MWKVRSESDANDLGSYTNKAKIRKKIKERENEKSGCDTWRQFLRHGKRVPTRLVKVKGQTGARCHN